MINIFILLQEIQPVLTTLAQSFERDGVKEAEYLRDLLQRIEQILDPNPVHDFLSEDMICHGNILEMLHPTRK
jgi:hypothetical protein